MSKHKERAIGILPILVALAVALIPGYFNSGAGVIDKYIIINWPWLVLASVVLLGYVLVPKIKGADNIAGGLLTKINSQKGIKLMDSLGAGHPTFWKDLADAALILLFAGVGAGYVASKRGVKGKQVIAAILAALAILVLTGALAFSFLPFALVFNIGLESLVATLAVAALVYFLIPKLSSKKASIIILALGILAFGGTSFYGAFVYGDMTYVLTGLLIGAFGIPFYLLIPLVLNAGMVVAGASETPGLNIGYPDVENGIPVLKYAGTDLSIPIFPDILIALIIMLALHEGFHGLVARAQGISVKNTGLLFSSIIPLGAFVEPDPKKFPKFSEEKRTRVYAVGSFANIFVVAIVAYVLAWGLAVSGLVEAEGFYVGATVEGTGAAEVLYPGELVFAVDGMTTGTFSDFSKVLSDKAAGDTITLKLSNRTEEIILAQSPYVAGAGFAGVVKQTDPITSERGYAFSPGLSGSKLAENGWDIVFSLLKWIFFLNLAIGIFNLLPFKPLDGGYCYEAFFNEAERGVKGGKKIKLSAMLMQFFTLFILAVFFLNFLPYFL